MKSRIEEVLSRILSEKHDAIIKVTFKEIEDEQRRDNHGTCGIGSNAGERNQETEKQSSAN